jgi:hypothetical protein
MSELEYGGEVFLEYGADTEGVELSLKDSELLSEVQGVKLVATERANGESSAVNCSSLTEREECCG